MGLSCKNNAKKGSFLAILEANSGKKGGFWKGISGELLGFYGYFRRIKAAGCLSRRAHTRRTKAACGCCSNRPPDRRPSDRNAGGLLPQHESEGLQRAAELPMEARCDQWRRLRE